MSGFTAEWLALREAADARARAPALASMLRERLASRRAVAIVDLGSGTGANLRATAPLLGKRQSWRLVDHDQALLDEAAARLVDWADAGVLSRVPDFNGSDFRVPKHSAQVIAVTVSSIRSLSSMVTTASPRSSAVTS